MRIFLKRCAQCGDQYEYQASGGEPPPYNDGTWCHNCRKVVSEALAKVPRLFECRYRDVREVPKFACVTREMLFKWDRERRQDPSLNSVIQRIWPGLCDLETGDAQKIREIRGRGHDIFNGIAFRLSTWDLKDEHTIEVPMEYDLQKNAFTGQLWR